MTESENFGVICGKDGEREDRPCVCEGNLLRETESDPLIVGRLTELLIEQIILKSNVDAFKSREKKKLNLILITEK